MVAAFHCIEREMKMWYYENGFDKKQEAVLMTDNKNGVRLGEGVADSLKQETNQELTNIGSLLIKNLSAFIQEKAKNIDFNQLLSKEDEKEILTSWSAQLVEEGLVPKGYIGLPDKLLLENIKQTGYIDGLYAGYALAMMSLADNNAPKDLLLSVRDDIRPNLMGHHYKDSDEFIERFRSEKYKWIDSLRKED